MNIIYGQFWRAWLHIISFLLYLFLMLAFLSNSRFTFCSSHPLIWPTVVCPVSIKFPNSPSAFRFFSYIPQDFFVPYVPTPYGGCSIFAAILDVLYYIGINIFFASNEYFLHFITLHILLGKCDFRFRRHMSHNPPNVPDSQRVSE